jgi:hypothetical protein
MATSITTNGKKKISTFKMEFSSKFPYLTIQFLDQKRKEYDNELNLVSIRTKKGDDISISGQNKINSLESKFEKTLGIAIEVCYSKNSKLIRTKSNNDKTLSELNKWCEANGCDLILTNKKVLKGKKSVATKSNGKKKVPILELQDIDLIISEIKALPVKSKIEVTSYKDSIEQWEEFYTIKVKKSIVELKVTRQFFDSYWRAVISRNDLISSLEIYKEEKDWVRKGNRLYLVQPDEFSYLDESLPTKLKELASLYKSVEDKCIVTARPQRMRNKIESVLKQFGLENPKWGLHMCPDGKVNAGKWKGDKIVELSETTGFQNVIFYDDNSKYIRGAKKVVSEKLPNLNFKTVKVI